MKIIPPKNNKYPQLENLFSPHSPVDFLGFAGVGVLINLLSGGAPIGFLGVAVLFIKQNSGVRSQNSE